MTKTATNLVYVLAALLFTVGCGHYPAPIRSAWSIKTTPASEYMVVIDGLPLADWPQLAKFRDLQLFNIALDFAASVTDAHLVALSKADFPKLRQVSLAYAGQVTDAGLNSFTNFRSVQGFQLIGVGITDKGLETLFRSLHRT